MLRSLLILALAAGPLMAQPDSASIPVDLDFSAATLPQVLDVLAVQTRLLFVLAPGLESEDHGRYTAKVTGITLRQALDMLFEGSPLAWDLTGRRVTVRRAGSAPPPDRPFLEIKNPFTTGTLEMRGPTAEH